MAPLDAHARRLGREAMNGKLTAARRVQRRLRAGRPAPLPDETPTLMQALHRAMTEADRAQNIMHEEGLSPDLIGLKLAFMQAGKGTMGFKTVPQPGEKLFRFFEDLEKHEDAIFPGILWALREEETGKTLAWVTAFSANPEANAHLLAAADAALHAAPQTGLPVVRRSKD